LASKSNSQFQPISDILEHIAICHSVIIDPQTNEYSASSPDEEALVKGAAYLGFEFVKRTTDNEVTIKYPEVDGEERKECTFMIRNILEFNSTRKRMSVIVYCKKNKSNFHSMQRS
jgi:magnesium-transporting ATPase (P-type)